MADGFLVDRQRRWFRWLLIVSMLLALQGAVAIVGFSRHAASYGLSGRASFMGLSGQEAPGWYVGNEKGIWCLWQLGWRSGDPSAIAEPIDRRRFAGIGYTLAATVHIRFAHVSVLWTILPNAALLLFVAMRWRRVRRAARFADASHDRGFTPLPAPVCARCPTCGQRIEEAAV